MNSLLLRTSTVLLISLTLTGCGRGWRDSLVLTGLRNKPDESKIVMLEPLVIPQNDEVVVPNSTTSADVLRGDVYKVHEILYGNELATQEAQRQFEVARQGALSPGEAHLLQRARSVNSAGTQVPVVEKKRRGLFGLRLPKLFRRQK